MPEMDAERIAAIRAHGFPIQRGYPPYPKPHPRSIPWEIAKRAYSVYSAKYGTSQSLERLAERGGFSPGEMDMFLPGWLDEVSVFTALRAEVDRQRKALEKAYELFRDMGACEGPCDHTNPECDGANLTATAAGIPRPIRA